MTLNELPKHVIRKICQFLLATETDYLKRLNNVLRFSATSHHFLELVCESKLLMSYSFSLPCDELQYKSMTQMLKHLTEETHWMFKELTVSIDSRLKTSRLVDSILNPFLDYKHILKDNLETLTLKFASSIHYSLVWKLSHIFAAFFGSDKTTIHLEFRCPESFDENDDTRAMLSFPQSYMIKSINLGFTLTANLRMIQDLVKHYPHARLLNLTTMLPSPLNDHHIDPLILSKFRNLKEVLLEEFTDTDNLLSSQKPLFPHLERLQLRYLGEKNVFLPKFIESHMPKLQSLCILHGMENTRNHTIPTAHLSPLHVRTLRVHYMLLAHTTENKHLENLCLVIRGRYWPHILKETITKVRSNVRIFNIDFDARLTKKELLELALGIIRSRPLTQVISVRSKNIDQGDSDASHKRLLHDNKKFLKTQRNLKLLIVESRPVVVTKYLEGWLINQIDYLDSSLGWNVRKPFQEKK